MNNKQILETSLMLALLFPAGIIVAGVAISGIQKWLAKGFRKILGGHFTFVLINYLMFPGVMLHEISHALMTILTGAELTHIALFEPDGDTLGYITYRERGPRLLQGVQRVLIASAPVYLGAGFVYLFYYLIAFTVSGVFIKVILGYCAVAMIFHMTMSSVDFKNFFEGLLYFIPAVFVLSIIVLNVIINAGYKLPEFLL